MPYAAISRRIGCMNRWALKNAEFRIGLPVIQDGLIFSYMNIFAGNRKIRHKYI